MSVQRGERTFEAISAPSEESIKSIPVEDPLWVISALNSVGVEGVDGVSPAAALGPALLQIDFLVAIPVFPLKIILFFNPRKRLGRLRVGN